MIARSFVGTVAMGFFLAPPLAQAQQVSAEVVLGSIDYHSRIADRPVFRVVRGNLEVSFWYPRRGYVVVERYEVFRPRITTIRLRRAQARAWLRRNGYRPVTVFVREGRLYRRHWSDPRGASHPNLRAVVLWERNGRFVRVVFTDGRPPVRRGYEHPGRGHDDRGRGYDDGGRREYGAIQDVTVDDGWYSLEDFGDESDD